MRNNPKKKLGQNFLTDRNIQKNIVASCKLNPNDSVLEIGAGHGEITSLIAGHVKFVYALEIDPLLCKALKKTLSEAANVKIINKDVLKFRPRLKKNKIKVVGNIPYYISTPIIEFIIKNRKIISSSFITVQKEFAQRIAALPGSKQYGALSCFVQYYCRPKILFYIKRASFYPMPEIDSCLLQLDTNNKPAVRVKNEKRFFKIIRSAFNQRRKILKNSLQKIIPQKKIQKFFKIYNIDSNTRPECLGLKDFARLANLCAR